MPTMKSIVEADIVSAGWCRSYTTIVSARPDDPGDWYDASTEPHAFLALLNVTNQAKAEAMFLQSLGELAADLPAGEEKTRLAAISNETADLADERTWFAANDDGASECRRLIDRAAEYLLGGNTLVCFSALRALVRARAEVDQVGIGEAADALLTLWKSRCTKVEWANGYT